MCIPGWNDLKSQLLLGIPLVEDRCLCHREGMGKTANSDPETLAEVDVRGADLHVNHTPLLDVVKTLSHERHENVLCVQGCGILPASTRNIPCKSSKGSLSLHTYPAQKRGEGR
jgi:hypothetical protein